MRSHNLAAAGHDDPIDIALDRHRAEGPGSRHAVTVGVEGHGLILVGDGLALDARIEGMPRQGQRGGPLFGETIADDEGAGGRVDRASQFVATT